ncbi:hypothetical protein [Ottowia thiooxydans]|uniref:hypothetical protein n=1 Tax=Ottowia thiooxydans TaxID=219182 RepID=UPI00048AEF8D|nr:hypothetical protein [Ottowia thiooxydans]
MQIHQGQFDFSLQTGGPASTAPQVHTFPNPVDRVFVVLRGFRVGFANGEDHHFGQVLVDLNSSVDTGTRTATINCVLGLRDKSMDFDDAYSGQVLYTLIAEP